MKLRRKAEISLNWYLRRKCGCTALVLKQQLSSILNGFTLTVLKETAPPHPPKKKIYFTPFSAGLEHYLSICSVSAWLSQLRRFIMWRYCGSECERILFFCLEITTILKPRSEHIQVRAVFFLSSHISAQQLLVTTVARFWHRHRM